MLSNLYNKPILIGGAAAAGGAEADPNCENTLDRTVNGYDDVVLYFVVPPDKDPPNYFIQNYRENPLYQAHIDRVWGAPAYDDGRQIFGIKEGWGHQCTGSYLGRRNSRNNAGKKSKAICCSKFRNGQAAFDINKAPEFKIGKGGNSKRNEDCGYGWSGKAHDWDPNLLNMTRRVAPPNRVAQVRQLQAKSIFGTDINLVSGDVFAGLQADNNGNNWTIYEQLEHLQSIYT